MPQWARQRMQQQIKLLRNCELWRPAETPNEAESSVHLKRPLSYSNDWYTQFNLAGFLQIYSLASFRDAERLKFNGNLHFS